MSTQEHGSQLNNLIVGNRLVDNLDGHDTAQHGVSGTVDSAESAAAYPLKDFVSADSLEHGVAREL